MFRRVLLATALAAAFAASASAATLDYAAKLTGAKEVPKTDSKGTGTFNATFDTETRVLKYTLTFDGLSGPATAAHIHGPATKTQNAAVVAPLGSKNPTSPISGSVTLTDAQAKELRTTKLYVNVHTAANPSGEIRGPIYRIGHRTSAVRAAPNAKTAPTASTAAAPAPATTK